MTQGERIKEIRKEYNLTLEKFGQKVGVGKTAISNIEKGNRNLTEQMKKSICREFSVDYDWLTTGIGQMLTKTENSFAEKIDNIMTGENEKKKNFFKALVDATDDDIEALDRIIDLYVNASKSSKNRKSIAGIYDDIPDTPKELENTYPTTEADSNNNTSDAG